MGKGNIEGRSRNYWCRAKAIRIVYSDCASVASFIQQANFMRNILIGGLCRSSVFSHIISKTVRLYKKYLI